jgi:ABC-type branched-subunit amino acid transport system ATPase component
MKKEEEEKDETPKQSPPTAPAYIVVSNEIFQAGAGLAAQVAELKDRLLRAQAEWDNSRKRILREKEEAVRYASEALLERLNLQSRRDLIAGLLSYAEQRALEIGITIAGGAEVILLDEPTAGMSNTETEYAVNLIRTVSEGKTLLMVEHDMSVVFGLADRVSVVVYGEVIASDVPAEIRSNMAVQEAYLGAEAQ